MDLEDNLLILMNRNQEVGLYDTLKKLTQKYADKISICDKRIEKKIFYGSYEILLKKVNINFTAIPVDFTDEDIINALYLHFGKDINDETVKKLLSKFEILYKAQHTEIFQNWVGPMVKMLYSISINQSDNLKRKNSRNKQDKVWFDVDFIPRSLQNLKNYLPQTEMKFFKFPKIYSSQSEDNLAIYRPAQLPPSLIFNSIFKERNIRLRQQNMSCELDEGFVTPSEEHKEKSPYSENRTTFQASANKKFNWDFKVVCVPPSKYKTWEKFDLLGRKPEHPFLPKKINYQYWLSKAPHCFKKVSKSQLLDDMMSLLIGIPSTSFNYNGESFSLASGLYTDDHTMEEVMQMTKPYIEAAEAFIALKKLSENTSHGDTIMCAFKIALEQYLYKYQLMIFHLFNINNNNESYPSDVGLLMEQIIHLRLLLIHPEELKGITLLKRLYDNMVNTSTQKFYLLSYLFLLPCVYYFRLIDDWIFLGRWHKDLPITPCDITLVQDRKSWEEVYKPIQTDTPWFIPVPDLAHCGKALLLLSTSKRNEKFLSMLKSDDRPRIKLCIQSHQLKELESECYIYYKKAKNTFHTEEHKELDLAFCAEKSAKMRAQAFEELKKGKKECELERKKIELNLREEDLIRSANVKQALKREEELDNMRVAAQVEEIRFKEALLELDRAKKVYATLQQEHEKAEKSDLVAERKLKREQNNEKIQECLDNKIMLKESLPDEAEDLKLGIMENLVRLENKNHVKVSPTADKSHYLDGQKGEDNKIPRGYLCNEEPLELNVDCHESKYSELTRNRLKVLSSNLGVGEQMAPCLSEEISNKNEINCSQCQFPDTTEKAPTNIVEQPSALAGYLCKEGPFELNVDCHETKYSELTRNRLKVLSSNLGVGEQMAPCLSEEISNKNGMNVLLCEFPETTEKAPDNIVEQPSDLSKNRLKSLHSDFARGDEFKITIGQEEAENNKKKILGTHFVLGTELSVYNKILKANADSNIENSNLVNEKSKVVGDDTTKTNETVEDAINNSPQQVDSDNVSKENIIEEGSSFNLDLSCDIAAETSSMDKIDDQPEAAKEYSNVNWFHNCNKHAGTFTYLFKDDNQILLPEQSFDYYSLLKVVPGSLKVVLDTQVKLVNEALMEMFLKELKLLDEAAKLKKYFFLDGEFGKKLTASLCTIIEKERPSTLLTFGKLRDILSFPSQGDEKLSFIVKEIPVAFEHTNPQVLSCLGLSYRFDWPLNLIFTEIAVSKYNDVFEYILSLQRVTWQLEQVWIALKFKSQINGEEYTQIQLYRHIMSQFVCTLQWYISTTVFEHSWQKFKRDVMEVTNLQELYRKHAAYIKDIIFKCFLEERSSGLMKKIQNLLKCILIFCQVMRFGEWSISESGVYRHCNFVKLQNTFSSFLKLARYIIRQIEKLVKVNYQEGLANLYNMFTINSFYLS